MPPASFDRRLADLDAILERPADPRMQRWSAIVGAVAKWARAGGQVRSRVARVVADGTLERDYGDGLLTLHDPRNPEVLLVQEELADAVQRLFEAPILQPAAHHAASNLSFLCHGIIAGIGPADDARLRHDRRITLRSPQLRLVLQGSTGLAARVMLSEVIAVAMPHPGEPLRSVADGKVWHPSPAAVPSALVGALVTDFLSQRGMGAVGIKEAAFADEVRLWIRDGGGAAALNGALGRVAAHRGLRGAARTEAVTEMRSAVLRVLANADPGWVTGEVSGSGEMDPARVLGTAAAGAAREALKRVERQQTGRTL